jgi:hypothetical protein
MMIVGAFFVSHEVVIWIVSCRRECDGLIALQADTDRPGTLVKAASACHTDAEYVASESDQFAAWQCEPCRIQQAQLIREVQSLGRLQLSVQFRSSSSVFLAGLVAGLALQKSATFG